MEMRATSLELARMFNGPFDAPVQVAAAAGDEEIAREACKLAERVEQGRLYVACVG